MPHPLLPYDLLVPQEQLSAPHFCTAATKSRSTLRCAMRSLTNFTSSSLHT